MSRAQAGVILLIALLQIASCQGPEQYPTPAAGASPVNAGGRAWLRRGTSPSKAM